MEPVIFWTLSAFLGWNTPYINSVSRIWMTLIKDNRNKLTIMKESLEWFTIKLDNKAYPVYRMVQADESVVFIVEIEERKIKLYRIEDDRWIGDAEQDLIDRIGKAIEEA